MTIDGHTLLELVAGLENGQAGVCLCDDNDVIRYVNAAFRSAFFPDLPQQPVDFVEAIATAIASGRGIRLQSMGLDAFVPRIRARRKDGPSRFNFSVDMTDGRWWWVNDYRLPNGWILVVASDVTTLKGEEDRLKDAHAQALVAAQTDYLTGIANRRAGIEQFEFALAEFGRIAYP